MLVNIKLTPCGGPTLPQLDPPYLGGITTPDTSDLKVIREETNPVLHPGDGRQRQRLRAVTWIQKAELNGSAARNVGAGVPNHSKTKDGEGNEEDARDTPDDGRGETSGGDLRIGTRTAGQIRGREAPNPDSGHTRARAWPIQVCGTH
ncbi:hypothetical protein NDU88_003056 [Pleurodeles waltl]|uniref:Uncharacterized protein n=1 Tax=Pleurodeles waltl TaxID=8319 RepID=A0AAV7NFL3_PLEWA|nr:hypothetical protein NDU88_003056 [Pleurodeles waltl]